MKRVVLDMDPGVDDALALILALRSPELQVQAITTVSGNVHVDCCVRNCLRVLTLLALPAGAPVSRGCERPLVKAPFNVPSVHGRDGLGELGEAFYGDVDETPLVSTHAVDVILDLVRGFPGEITIVATGPLTNVATAIQRDPRTMRQIKGIVVMGGAVSVPGNIPPGAAEFNCFADPEATKRVLGFGVPIVLVPLDVTHKVPLTREVVRREFGAAPGRIPEFVAAASRMYMDFYLRDQGHDGCYLHDPLAVGVVIDPSFVQTEAMRIYVATAEDVTAGMTLPFRHSTRDAAKIDSPNVAVVTRVDADRFLEFFLGRVRGAA